jgi:hypothetical protein
VAQTGLQVAGGKNGVGHGIGGIEIVAVAGSNGLWAVAPGVVPAAQIPLVKGNAYTPRKAGYGDNLFGQMDSRF